MAFAVGGGITTFGDRHGAALATLSLVGGAIDAWRAGRTGAGEHHARIDRVDGHAPDHGPAHRRVEPAPLPPAVVADVETHVGPGIDDARPPGIGEQGLDDPVKMHSLPPPRPTPVPPLVPTSP